MNRIAVVGKTGSGKTTLAKQLANRRGLEHIELDALSWLPNWVQRTDEEFRTSVESRTRASHWVTDGNYSVVCDYVWGRANTLVWLDYSLLRVLWQITARTARRYASQELLWGTNVEQLRHVVGDESLYKYAIRAHTSNRKDYPRLLQTPEYRHLQLVRLKTHRQAQAWLAGLK